MKKILDIQQSIEATNGNVSLAKELFAMLLDDLPLKQQQIESSLNEANMDALTEHIHKLYGATAYCIIPQLRECTAMLDEQLRKKNHSQVDMLVKKVQEEIQQLINMGPEFAKQNWSEFKLSKSEP